jgi:ribosome-associated protein
MYLEAHIAMYQMDMDYLERHCVVEFVKASGPGGQHRNKRETGVRLYHPSAHVTVTATERRSQARNRAIAFERMIERLTTLNQEAYAALHPRRIPPPPRSVDAHRRALKSHRSGVKSQRSWRSDPDA